MKSDKLVIVFVLVLFSQIGLYAQGTEWLWAERAGGTGTSSAFSITTDSEENSYITGWFTGVMSFGDTVLESGGVFDIFVAKMDSNGEWLWAKRAGGTYEASGNAITLDSHGNVYVTGQYGGVGDFGDFELTAVGGTEIFVAKLDSDGNWLWASRAGDYGTIMGYGITVDGNEDIIVIGEIYGSADFGNYTVQGYFSWGRDVVIAKIDNQGEWLWAKRSGDDTDLLVSSVNRGQSVAVDSTNNIYITGRVKLGGNFGDTYLDTPNISNVFVAKLNEDGEWLWALQAGSNGNDNSYDIIVDDNDRIYVTGWIDSHATFGDHDIQNLGDKNLFVARIDANGNWLWAIRGGGNVDSQSYAITAGENGDVYICGWFVGVGDFGEIELTSSGARDVFVAQIDDQGNWIWAEMGGGPDFDIAIDLAVLNGDLYVGGYFYDVSEFGNHILVSEGHADIFIAKSGILVGVDDELLPAYEMTKLSKNYPNPFNPQTVIELFVSDNETGVLEIYNTKGRRLESEEFSSGKHRFVWNAEKFSSGVYFYRLLTGSYSETRKMLLMK